LLQRYPRATVTAAPDNFPKSGPPQQSRQATIFRLAALFIAREKRMRYHWMKVIYLLAIRTRHDRLAVVHRMARIASDVVGGREVATSDSPRKPAQASKQ
jgi:hypothetical protein